VSKAREDLDAAARQLWATIARELRWNQAVDWLAARLQRLQRWPRLYAWLTDERADRATRTAVRVMLAAWGVFYVVVAGALVWAAWVSR
jgi:hypothetical protein